MNSPRQKLAISSERNVQIPEMVKIGCDHQSENGFAVHPSNCAFEAPPVKSPKWVFIQNIHAMIGIAVQATSAPSAGIAPRSFRERACARLHDATTATATKISGRLLSFVRYVAAIDEPVAIPRPIFGRSGESQQSRQMNVISKQIGERTS